ncbi:MAG: hypothetical protein AB1757_00940 [Acidobacteriota bacterium]
MSLSDQIQQRIDELLADAERMNSEEWQIAASQNALPIYPGWTGYIAIRPDGSFLFCGDDGTVENSVEPEWQLVALIEESKKHPELEALLPRRTAAASVCVDCQGSGRSSVEGQQFDTFICGKCYGLGWVDEQIKALSEEVRARIPGAF